MACDRERLVLQVGRRALGESHERRVVVNDLRPLARLGLPVICSDNRGNRTPVQWEDIVPRRFGPPEIRELLELGRLTRARSSACEKSTSTW
jgi:hypothetical protein